MATRSLLPFDLETTTFSGPDIPSDEIINTCVRCGFCLDSCPTYLETRVETSSPRGRIYLMKSVTEGRLDVTSAGFVHQMYECLDCRACEAVCPSGVAYGQLVEPARAQVERHVRRPLFQRALRAITFRLLFRYMSLFRVQSNLFKVYQRSGLQWLLRSSGLLQLLGLAELERFLPRMSARFFVPEGQVYPAVGRARATVGIFAGCIMSTAFASIDRATARVLARNGCDVVAPPAQGCCGALNVHSGDLESARAMMRENIAAFERFQLDAIIINAAGCGSTLKEYGHLLRDDPAWAERARNFSAKVKDFSEFLAGVGLAGAPGALPARVTYQDACHLAHAQRITKQPRDLLRAIPGIELVEMKESSLCCGSAGVYNVTNPEMSRRLMDRKAGNVANVLPEIVVSANPGCMLQLRRGLERADAKGVQVKHIAEVLDEAYRRAERPGGEPRPRHEAALTGVPAGGES